MATRHAEVELFVFHWGCSLPEPRVYPHQNPKSPRIRPTIFREGPTFSFTKKVVHLQGETADPVVPPLAMCLVVGTRVSPVATMVVAIGGGTGRAPGNRAPFDFGILTLALWALHGKNGIKSRQCPP